MKIEDFTKAITYLGMAYNKEFKEQEVKQYYEFLKQIDYETFKKAIKEIIKESKYMPSIKEMLDKCEILKLEKKYDIIEKMKEVGYFKNPSEIDKVYKFFEKGIIPNWLYNDMRKYGYQEELGYNDRLLLN